LRDAVVIWIVVKLAVLCHTPVPVVIGRALVLEVVVGPVDTDTEIVEDTEVVEDTDDVVDVESVVDVEDVVGVIDEIGDGVAVEAGAEQTE
jgi:hypothetical protein